MILTLASDSIDLGILVVAIGAAGLSLWAIIVSIGSRNASKRANEIAMGQNQLTQQAVNTSREAVHKADTANDIAQRALDLEEDQGKVKIVVKPQMLLIVSAEPGELTTDEKTPRPVVTVINLSTFPVTVTSIGFRTEDGVGLYWKNPSIANPYGSLPARLAPRTALTAFGKPMSADKLATVTACVAYTECGETIEGMTDQFKEYIDKAKAELAGTAVAPTK